MIDINCVILRWLYFQCTLEITRVSFVRVARLDWALVIGRGARSMRGVRWDGDFKCQLASQLEASAGSTSQSLEVGLF